MADVPHELPSPPIDAEIDLTDFGFMPLDVRRLRDSKLAASVDGEQFRCAVLLWCASWHQLPAGSLPDDDIELANLAGFGRMVPQWKKIRNGALYGWTKCSDGRLYHAVVVEKAIEAWNSKLDTQYRRECDRLRKENKRRQENQEQAVRIPSFEQWNSERRSHGLPTDFQRNSAGSPTDTLRKSKSRPADSVLKGQGQGQGDLRDRDIIPSDTHSIGNTAKPSDRPNGSNPPTELLPNGGTRGDGGEPLTYEQAQELQAAYPKGIYRESEWIVVQKLVNAHLDNGVAFERILASFHRYHSQIKARGKLGTEFVQSPVKHCDLKMPQFDEPFPLPATKSDIRLAANLSAAEEFMRRTEEST
jgi:Protein of unknown function (DUF1376)